MLNVTDHAVPVPPLPIPSTLPYPVFMQIEKMHDSGERAGLATAVMEHATAMVNLASALFVCKKWVEAKVREELGGGGKSTGRGRGGGGGGC